MRQPCRNRWTVCAAVVLELVCGSAAWAAVSVDAQLPAGNIACERIEGDQVSLRQERRGSSQWWFYWAFRVCGAEGRTLTFTFSDGEPVGTRGPAVSTDRGRSWQWLGQAFTAKRFTYTFAPAEQEVWFAFGMVYTQAEWDRFLARQAASPGLERGRLTATRKGRTVETLRAGCIGHEPRYRVLLTARHHCCEMMASYALEGLLEGVLADDEAGCWLRENVEFLVIPFVDKDGVEEGDQGKYRAPRDHNRDYDGTSLYPETAAIREQVPAWAHGALTMALDLHCPWIRGTYNEWVYQVGSENPELWAQQQAFGQLLERVEPNVLAYRQADDLPHGRAWNTSANYAQGMSAVRWAATQPGIRFAGSVEIPYATANGKEVNADSARRFGASLAVAMRRYLGSLKEGAQRSGSRP